MESIFSWTWVAAAAGALYVASAVVKHVLGTNKNPSPRPRRALKKSDAEIIELRNFTPSELAEFDGRKKRNIYLAVKGKVYDVSPGESFYGPNGPYGNFAGRDASRGLAMDSFDEDTLTPIDHPIDKLEGLEEDERESLENWASFFAGKYRLVGYLVNAEEDVPALLDYNSKE